MAQTPELMKSYHSGLPRWGECFGGLPRQCFRRGWEAAIAHIQTIETRTWLPPNPSRHVSQGSCYCGEVGRSTLLSGDLGS